jgi:hypothetical protein
MVQRRNLGEKKHTYEIRDGMFHPSFERDMIYGTFEFGTWYSKSVKDKWEKALRRTYLSPEERQELFKSLRKRKFGGTITHPKRQLNNSCRSSGLKYVRRKAFSHLSLTDLEYHVPNSNVP